MSVALRSFVEQKAAKLTHGDIVDFAALLRKKQIQRLHRAAGLRVPPTRRKFVRRRLTTDLILSLNSVYK